MAKLGRVLKRLLAYSLRGTARFLAFAFNYLVYPFTYFASHWALICEYFSNPQWLWNLFFLFLQWLFNFDCLHDNGSDCKCFNDYDEVFGKTSEDWEARIVELQADLEDRRARNSFLEASQVLLEEKIEEMEERLEICEENHKEAKEHVTEAWENRRKMGLLKRDNVDLKERLERYEARPPGSLIQSQEKKLMQVNLDLHRQVTDLEKRLQIEIDRRQKGLAMTIMKREKKDLENQILQLSEEVSVQRDELAVCEEIRVDREKIKGDARNAKGELDYWKRQFGVETEGPSKWMTVEKYEEEKKKVDDCRESKNTLIVAYDAALRTRKDSARAELQLAQMERDMVKAQLKVYRDKAAKATEGTDQHTDLKSANLSIDLLKGLIDDLKVQLEQCESRGKNEKGGENSDVNDTSAVPRTNEETISALEAAVAKGRRMIERCQPRNDMTPAERAQCGISRAAFEDALNRFESQVKVLQSLYGAAQDTELYGLKESELVTLIEKCEENFWKHCRCTDVEVEEGENKLDLSTIQAFKAWIAGTRKRIESCQPPSSITQVEAALCNTVKTELKDALLYLEAKVDDLRSPHVEHVDAKLQALAKGEAVVDVIRCEAEVVKRCHCSAEGEVKGEEDRKDFEEYMEAMVELKRKMDGCPRVVELTADDESSCAAAYDLLERQRSEMVTMIQAMHRGQLEDSQAARDEIKKKVYDLEGPLTEFKRQCRCEFGDEDKSDRGDEENMTGNELEYVPPEADPVAPMVKQLEKRREVSNFLGSIINATLDYIIHTVSKIKFIQIPESISGMHRYTERTEGDPPTLYELSAITDLWNNVVHLYDWFVFLNWLGSAADWKPSGLLLDRDDELAKNFYGFKSHIIQAEPAFRALFAPLEEEQFESDAKDNPPENSEEKIGQESGTETREEQLRNSLEILEEQQNRLRWQTYNELATLINQIKEYAGATIIRSSITDLPNFPFADFPSHKARDEHSTLTTLGEITEQEKNLTIAMEWFVSVKWPSRNSDRWPGLDPDWQPSGSDPETPLDEVGRKYRDFKTRADAAHEAARTMREDTPQVLGDKIRRGEAYNYLAQLINDISTYITETITTYPIITRLESHALIPEYRLRDVLSAATTNEEVTALWADIDRLFEWILTVNWLGMVDLHWPGTDPNWKPSAQTPETHGDHVGRAYQRIAERARVAAQSLVEEGLSRRYLL